MVGRMWFGREDKRGRRPNTPNVRTDGRRTSSSSGKTGNIPVACPGLSEIASALVPKDRGPELCNRALLDLGVAPRRAALDVHRLDIHEFADAVPRKLAAEARALHSPERHSRIGGNHRVDERLPGIELIDELLLLLRVACPNAAAQAKRAVVGQSDR